MLNWCSKPRTAFWKLDITSVVHVFGAITAVSIRRYSADLIEFIVTTLVAQLLQLANSCSSVNHEATGYTY